MYAEFTNLMLWYKFSKSRQNDLWQPSYRKGPISLNIFQSLGEFQKAPEVIYSFRAYKWTFEGPIGSNFLLVAFFALSSFPFDKTQEIYIGFWTNIFTDKCIHRQINSGNNCQGHNATAKRVGPTNWDPVRPGQPKY